MIREEGNSGMPLREMVSIPTGAEPVEHRLWLWRDTVLLLLLLQPCLLVPQDREVARHEADVTMGAELDEHSLPRV